MWDIQLEFVEDETWNKMDCDDRKVILLSNVLNPLRENLEEIIVYEWMHIKMYPLDQVSESLILNCFEDRTCISTVFHDS